MHALLFMLLLADTSDSVDKQLRYLRTSELQLHNMGEGIHHGYVYEHGKLRIRAIKTRHGYGWKTTHFAERFKPKTTDERIVAETARIESGRPYGHYDACTTYDTAGAYFGIIQWSAHVGNLQKLLLEVHDRDPETYLAHLPNYVPVRKNKRTVVLVDRAGAVHDLVNLRHLDFCRGLTALARYPHMKAVQKKQALRWLKRAKRVAKDYGFTSIEGMATVYSLSVCLGFAGVMRILRQVDERNDEDFKLLEVLQLIRLHHPGRLRRINSIKTSRIRR